MSHQVGYSFDWKLWCEHQGISYKDRGPGTSKGHINIDCPWCAEGQGSRHLGLRLGTSLFYCWKDPRHRGTHAVRLLQAIQGGSWTDAAVVAKEYASEGFGPWKVASPTETPVLTPEFVMPQGVSSVYTSLAQRYLAERGFCTVDAQRLGILNGGRQAWEPFVYRVVFPIFDDQGKLRGVTGRAVGKDPLRYLTHPIGIPVPNVLGRHWLGQSRKYLIVVEGPFDAAKLQLASTFFKLPFDVVALRTVSPSLDLQEDVERLSFQYERTIFMMDDSQYHRSLVMAEKSRCPATAAMCGAKDPATLSLEQANTMLVRLWASLMPQDVYAPG